MKRKKTERQKLIKKLDDIVREIIKDRDRGICQKCGNAGNHVSHVYSRKNLTLRWDLNNLKLLCTRCHLYWWHKEPIDASMWFQNEFPYRADYLMEVKNITKTWRVDDLVEKYNELCKIKEKGVATANKDSPLLDIIFTE